MQTSVSETPEPRTSVPDEAHEAAAKRLNKSRFASEREREVRCRPGRGRFAYRRLALGSSFSFGVDAGVGVEGNLPGRGMG
jgi:hypothetical protein